MRPETCIDATTPLLGRKANGKMDPRLDKTFWHDISHLSSDLRLATIWLVFGPCTDCLGVIRTNSTSFAAETGLLPEAMDAAIRLSPDLLQRYGNFVLARTFVRMQHADLLEPGLKSHSASNMCKKLVRALAGLPVELQSAIVGRYPILKALQANPQALKETVVSSFPSASPKPGQISPGGLGDSPEGLQGFPEAPYRTEQNSTHHNLPISTGGSGGKPPSLSQVIEFCVAQKISEEIGRAFFESREAARWRLGHGNGVPIADWKKNLNIFEKKWREIERTRSGKHAATADGRSHDELTAALQTEENEEKRRAIRARLEQTRTP